MTPTDDAAVDRPAMSIGLPSTPFTFKHRVRRCKTRCSITRHGSVQVTARTRRLFIQTACKLQALARPASAAADLGLSIRSSYATHPHAPFKFHYDDAVTRAKLEDMVSERTPTAAVPKPPRAARAADYRTRERKRLRLDVRPRKVMTGDLMSMPMLSNMMRQGRLRSSQVAAILLVIQPIVDYVKESAGFNERSSGGGPDSSLVETPLQSGRQKMKYRRVMALRAQNRLISSGQNSPFSTASASSPPNGRRSIGLGHRKHPSLQQRQLEITWFHPC